MFLTYCKSSYLYYDSFAVPPIRTRVPQNGRTRTTLITRFPPPLSKAIRCLLHRVAGHRHELPRLAQSAEPLSRRYPDPSLEVLDESFLQLRLFNASVEKIADGLRWAEGPVWVGDGRYLLLSDIPNNRIMRWDEISQSLGVFREQANFSNGLTRDREGRLVVCEGSTTHELGRRVTRTEHNGAITVLADNYQGKRFNSPNDVVVKRDGSIWFSDPPFQAGNYYEGHKIQTELPDAVYRIDGSTLEVTRVIEGIAGPNGLCFARREHALCGRGPRQAQPPGVGLCGERRRYAG